MKYINEINAFERWLETNYLPASSQLLWYKLIALFNRGGWAECVVLDNQRLMGLIQEYREDTAIKIRNKLIDAGLIEYQKGKKGSPNRYKLISLENKYTFTIEVQSGVESGVESGVYNEAQTADIKKDIDIDIDIDKDIGSIASMNEVTPKVVTSNKIMLPIAPYEKIVELYNSICISLNPVKKLTERRKQIIGARYRENGCSIEVFEELFTNAQSSDFLKGGGSKGWRADFDWILKPTNFVKILEGRYTNTNNFEKTNNSSNEVGKNVPSYGITL